MSVDAYNAIGVYLSGAASDGGPQGDPDLSLGGFRAANVASGLGFYCRKSIPFLVINFASESNCPGLGLIEAVTVDKLRWTAPAGSAGTAQEVIVDTPVKLSDGSDPEKYIIVTLVSDVDLKGTSEVVLSARYNNAAGFSDVGSSDRASGMERLRCLVLKNDHSESVSAIKAYVKPLSDAVVSDTSQLSASGAGQIQTTGTFKNWPSCGFCRIETSAGAEREIIYYPSRTDTTLSVDSAARGLLDTSAAAGASDDNLYLVPGIKIAYEADDSGFTTASSQIDTAAVSGLTFTTAITPAAGISVASLAAGAKTALWIICQTIAGQNASAAMENAVALQYTCGAVTVNDQIGGLYRIADSDLDRYEIYYGFGQEPDFDAEAVETFTELPYEIERFRTVISDGDFTAGLLLTDWSLGTNWTISEVETGIYAAVCSDPSDAGDLWQDILVTSGAEYELTYTVEITGTITVTPTIGGQAGSAQSSSGTYTEVIETDDTSGLYFSVSGLTGNSLIIKDVTLSLRRTGTHYFAIRKRNAYNLVSANRQCFKLTLDALAEQATVTPDKPVSIIMKATKSLTAKISAVYTTEPDNSCPATHWLVYVTDDGGDPDPATDSPETIAMSLNRGVAVLDYTTDPTTAANTIKAIVRTAVIDGEDVYESTNTDIYSVTAAEEILSAVEPDGFFGNNEVIV